MKRVSLALHNASRTKILQGCITTTALALQLSLRVSDLILLQCSIDFANCGCLAVRVSRVLSWSDCWRRVRIWVGDLILIAR